LIPFYPCSLCYRSISGWPVSQASIVSKWLCK